MPRVKKKSVEYGNRKRRKLAATKRSTLYCSSPLGERQFVYMPPMENHLQSLVTPTPSPPPPQLQPPQPTPQPIPQPIPQPPPTKLCYSPLLLPKTCPVEIQTEEKCLEKLNMEDAKTEFKYSTFPEALKDESLSDVQKSEIRRKYFSDLLSKCIITADKAAAAVMAVRCDSVDKKPAVLRKPRVPRKPKVEKPNKQSTKAYASVSKVSSSEVLVSKTPPASTQTATSKTTTANSKATSTTPPASNTQKAYALYVGGQLKYILPYNGLLAATNPNQPEGEMKKLICRGVNGKTEIALAKPTIVCDNEKKKIVFVVQKKSPGSPSQVVSKKETTECKPTKPLNLLTYSSFLNHGISDNMLKLLLPSFVPSKASTTTTAAAAAATTTTTATTTLPATTVVGSQVTSAASQSVVSNSQNGPTSTDKTNAISVTTSVNSTENGQQNVCPSSVALTTTTTSTKTLTTAVVTSTTTATTATTDKIPPAAADDGDDDDDDDDETVEDSGSIRPVKLFTRDSARKLCPTSSTISSVPVPTILDASEVLNSSGKSLLKFSPVLNENKQKTQSQSKETNEAADKATVTPTESHTDNVGNEDIAGNCGKAISNSDTTNSFKNLLPQSEPVIEECHTDGKEVSQDDNDDGDDDDDDDGMFGLKISSVFSLADEQVRSSEDDATASQLGENSEFVKSSSESNFFQVEQPQQDGFAENDNFPNEAKFQRVIINPPQSTSSMTSPRTVVVSMNNEAFTTPVQLTNPNEEISVDITIDSARHTKHVSVDHEKALTTKSPQNVEEDLDNNFNMTDSQVNNSQKENASPKNSSSSDKTEQDPKYISVDIRRRNGQTKVTAVTNPNLKKESAKSIANTLESVSSITSLGSAPPQGNSSTRLADELQCAAHSLPMGKYVFIPLSDKTVAIPSQGGKASRSAYIFEKSFNQNSMQVKIPKSFLVNSKDCSPQSAVANTNNGSQIVFQTNTAASKSLSDVLTTPAVDPLPNSSKESVPTLEAPPIVTGKRIRRPKKHTGFEEDIDFIPPVRKYRKKSKSVLKEKKSGMVASDNSKKTKSRVAAAENNTCLYYMKEGSNKVQLLDSKSELATVLRATGTSLELSKVDPVNGHRLLPSCSTSVIPTVTMTTPKIVSSVGTAADQSYQSCNSSGLRIDNVLSLQPNAVHIKSEPITSGYGDEPVKNPHVSILPLNPLVTVPHTTGVPDSLNLVQNIKKEPVKYGYEGDINPDSSVSLLTPINQHSSLSSIKEEKIAYKNCPENVAYKNLAYTQKDISHLSDSSKLYKMDKFTLPGSGKKLNCKKKAVGKKAAVKITGFPLESQRSSSSVTEDLSYTTPSPSNRSPMLHASTSTCYSHISPSKHNSLELPSASTSSVTLSSSMSGETPQEERIRRLREILREKEHSLELIRQNLAVSSTL